MCVKHNTTMAANRYTTHSGGHMITVITATQANHCQIGRPNIMLYYSTIRAECNHRGDVGNSII